MPRIIYDGEVAGRGRVIVDGEPTLVTPIDDEQPFSAAARWVKDVYGAQLDEQQPSSLGEQLRAVASALQKGDTASAAAALERASDYLPPAPVPAGIDLIAPTAAPVSLADLAAIPAAAGVVTDFKIDGMSRAEAEQAAAAPEAPTS